jgi:predicted HTH domain antitoxin
MASITIEIPDVMLEAHYQDNLQIKNEIQQGIIIWEYLNGRLSLRECSDLLQMKYRNFLELLWSKGIHLDALDQHEIQEQVDYLSQRLVTQK